MLDFCWNYCERDHIPRKLQNQEVVGKELPRSLLGKVCLALGTKPMQSEGRAGERQLWGKMWTSSCTKCPNVASHSKSNNSNSDPSLHRPQGSCSPSFNSVNLLTVLPASSLAPRKSCHHIACIMIFKKKKKSGIHIHVPLLPQPRRSKYPSCSGHTHST